MTITSTTHRTIVMSLGGLTAPAVAGCSEAEAQEVTLTIARDGPK